jgi:hypothetical protein
VVEWESAEEVVLGFGEGAKVIDLLIEPASEGAVITVGAEVGEGEVAAPGGPEGPCIGAFPRRQPGGLLLPVAGARGNGQPQGVLVARAG